MLSFREYLPMKWPIGVALCSCQCWVSENTYRWNDQSEWHSALVNVEFPRILTDEMTNRSGTLLLSMLSFREYLPMKWPIGVALCSCQCWVSENTYRWNDQSEWHSALANVEFPRILTDEMTNHRATLLLSMLSFQEYLPMKWPIGVALCSCQCWVSENTYWWNDQSEWHSALANVEFPRILTDEMTNQSGTLLLPMLSFREYLPMKWPIGVALCSCQCWVSENTYWWNDQSEWHSALANVDDAKLRLLTSPPCDLSKVKDVTFSSDQLFSKTTRVNFNVHL